MVTAAICQSTAQKPAAVCGAAGVQAATLFEAINQVQLGAMPPPQYKALHPESVLTPEQMTPEQLKDLREQLKDWRDSAQSIRDMQQKAKAAKPAG